MHINSSKLVLLSDDGKVLENKIKCNLSIQHFAMLYKSLIH